MNAKNINLRKNARGGARKGAGRKQIGAAPLVTVTLRMPPELRNELKRYVKKEGIPIRVFIERSLMAAQVKELIANDSLR